MNLDHALSVALTAAEAGARELLAGCGGERPRVSYKGRTDLVTEYDVRSEEVCRRIIGEAFPDHALVGEEKGRSGTRWAEYTWYLDPLDGTTNFAHGHPFFAVSIGLFGPGEAGGGNQPLVGVVNAPMLGELYWGRAGGGAFRRQIIPGRGPVERRLAVTDTDQLRQAMLNTGFPYDVHERGGELLYPFGRLLHDAQTVRRAGSAALDIAYVAAGLADAFWETGLKAWDVAAGLLLLSEAGGRVSDYRGRPYRLGRSGDLLGSNGRLHETILEYVRPEQNDVFGFPHR
jgi:myo-inositol-1(or 4)-monophosphatase